MFVEDIGIIGAGIAGYSAALLLTTFGYRPVIFSGSKNGEKKVSHVIATPELSNYPGILTTLTGEEFYLILEKQVKSCGVTTLDETVTKVVTDNKCIQVVTNERIYHFKTILLATGLSHIPINIKGARELYGKRIFRCIACDPNYPDVTDKTVCVIGCGDNAIETALQLNKTANHVIVFVRHDKLKASKVLINQLSRVCDIDRNSSNTSKNISIMLSTTITSIDENFINYCNNGTENKTHYDYIFVAIGHKPVTDFVEGLQTDDTGYVTTKHMSTETNILNVFACGIVANPKYQTTTATVGSGSMAATDIMLALTNNQATV